MKGRAFIEWLRIFAGDCSRSGAPRMAGEHTLLADAVEIADEAALHEIAFHTEEVGDWRRLFVSEVDPIMRRAMHYAIRRGLIERKEGEPHLVRFVKEAGE